MTAFTFWTGGFGGGGSGSSYVVGGGGGGYSGGGSGGNSTAGVGGGGGSFNAGTNQVNTGGTNSGNGVVTITYSISTPTTTQIAGLASGATFPVGTTTETYQVTSGSSTITCSFTITVTDAEAPVITAPANISVNNDPGSCGAVVTYTSPVASDNCSGTTITQLAGLASGATFPAGVTTQTYMVQDAAGLTDTCSFTVTVTDTEAPVITAPANISVNNDPGSCGAMVTYTSPVASDNCSGAIITQLAGLASGATFPAGVTTQVYMVQDAAGLSDTCSFTVTVTDTESPAFTTCQADVATCGDPIVTNIGPGAVTDNCTGIITVNYILSGATVAAGTGDVSGTSFNQGVTTVTYVAADPAGNTDTCLFHVTVHPLPAVTASATDTVSCVTGSVITLNGSPAGGTWSGTGVTGNSFSPSSANIGTFVLTYSYTDPNNCSSSANISVQVLGCAGLEDHALDHIEVYPNPSSDYVTINLQEQQSYVEIALNELNGKNIITRTYHDKKQLVLDLNEVSGGVYFLLIKTSAGTRSVKLVKK